MAHEREAVVIGAPLGEGIWLAARGVTRGLAGHRGGAIRPQNGIPCQKARYAFDFVGFDSSGRAFADERSRNENWIGYGAEVLAVADGLVVRVQDGIPDSQPFDPERLQGLTGETLGGNEIVLDIGNDLFAFYGHLIPGSLRVREGDRVRRGEVIGRLGSSGNSDAPHLHFQINRTIPISGEAIPYVLEEYSYFGEAGSDWLFNDASVMEEALSRIADRQRARRSRDFVSPGIAIADSMLISILGSSVHVKSGDGAPEWTQALGEGGEPRRHEMPGSNAVIRFRAGPPPL